MVDITVDKKYFLTELESSLKNLIKGDESPLVVFSSTWPFLNEMENKNMKGIEELLDIILRVAGNRTVLMPTFTSGFTEGLLDLDKEPATTGALAECFRKRPGVKRSLSAFFSFAVSGSRSNEVYQLKAEEAWGKGSVYEWMENNNVTFLMFGTHPTHCSYLHRLELLAKNKINYRFNKKFSGKIIRNGITQEVEETLYVRRLDPPVTNDFTVLVPHLFKAGMEQLNLNGISLVSYKAKALLNTVLPAIMEDPYLTVKNRTDYEGKI